MRGQARPACRKRASDRESRRLAVDARAVTPLVGTVLILAIAVAGLAVVMTWGLPALKQTQADAELTGVLHQFENLEELAENVVRSGGVGKANEGTLSFTEGQVQRADGTLFILSMHPYDAPSDERYWLEATRGADRYILTVHAGPGVVTTDRWVDVHVVTAAGETFLSSTSAWAGGSVDLADVLYADAEEGSVRVQVMTEENEEDVVIMESWLLPSGAFEYTRQTSFGEVSMRLEFGSVITTYESGSHIHTQPLARLEHLPDGLGGENPSFFGFFAQLLVADPAKPGVESAGPGGHPIRLSLQENVLRIGGAQVAEVGVQAIGERAAVWEEMYEERYGFIPAEDALYFDGNPRYAAGTPGVVLGMGQKDDPDAGTLVPDPFQFVLMESRIEITLLEGTVRLDA